MPKIIGNLTQRLTQEARRQVREAGYGAMTIRSVAKSCGIAIGTVYNYYPSKDALIAAFLLEDWMLCVRAIEECAALSPSPSPVLETIHIQLLHFYHHHEGVFRDKNAAAGFSGSFSRYHGVLRSQLSAPIRKYCRDDFMAEFIAEAMLVWTIYGKAFDEINDLIQKLF